MKGENARADQNSSMGTMVVPQAAATDGYKSLFEGDQKDKAEPSSERIRDYWIKYWNELNLFVVAW